MKEKTTKKNQIFASLADLKQDIAGPIPVDLIANWQKGEKSLQRQIELLEPFERKGYLVSSDAAGLSVISKQKPLLEVLKMVNWPKEIIYSEGKNIGGKGVGVWAADNSQMFYDESVVDGRKVLGAMIRAQSLISSGEVQVGLGIHKGIFWEIGNGMFGPEADLIEEVAEECSSGGEIVISGRVLNEVGEDYQSRFKERRDLSFDREKFFSLFHNNSESNIEPIKNGDVNDVLPDCYPIPFDRKFYDLLRMDGRREELESYLYQKVVVVVKIYHQNFPVLLDKLTDWVVMNAMLREVYTKYNVQMVKSNGDLAIFVGEDENEAVLFAEELLMLIAGTEDKVSIGLAKGEVLLFNLEGGGKEIAGGPVNVASKISEDVDDFNSLFIDESVRVPANRYGSFMPYSIVKSRVTLKGNRYIDI